MPLLCIDGGREKAGRCPAGKEAYLIVDFNTAKKFCVSWFKLALDEALLIWKARNLAKHGGDQTDLIPWHEMVRQYHNALIELQKQGQDIPDRPQIRKANLTTMQKYIDKASELFLIKANWTPTSPPLR